MKKEAIDILGTEYKIHLMPSMASGCGAFESILRSMNSWQLETPLIKIRADYDHTEHKTIMPIIVIYSYGKETTKENLELIKEKFKGWAGTNETPRYNYKVTSFIYVAGGDGDTKKRVQAKYMKDDIMKRGVFSSDKMQFFAGHELY
jgi:hypothetical protein